ncbi:MAG: hypothetical protein HY701_00185 [Gemmatimonadetes bacterium]|nr:hypothetical protein [Gemmatimonadota bacterium]
MAGTPKRIKRLLREYAAAAHEEDLRRALLPVAEAFKRWERKELDSAELSEIIHSFHQGPARDLWVRYTTPHLEMAVALAITTGVLSRDTIPAELLDHLAGPLRFYEEGRATSRITGRAAHQGAATAGTG